jgi:hypothetical protein
LARFSGPPLPAQRQTKSATTGRASSASKRSHLRRGRFDMTQTYLRNDAVCKRCPWHRAPGEIRQASRSVMWTTNRRPISAPALPPTCAA